MKKYFLLLLFFPFLVFASNDIEIKSIDLFEKSDNTQIIEDAIIEEDNIKLNVKFYDINDYVKYKIVIKNVSNYVFKIKDGVSNINSDYIIYEVSVEDNDETIKINDKKTIYLTLRYNKEVEKSKFISGKYNESKSLNINILNGELIINDGIINTDNTKNTVNPNTVDVIIAVIVVLFISIISLMFLKQIRVNKYYLFIILLLPILVNAIKEYQIKLNSSIEIGLVKPNPCTYEGELVEGAIYNKEQYDYIYIEELDGWRLSLTNKELNDPVTSKICTRVNDKPIVSMSGAFSGSNTSSIDLSSFDTSNVVDMSGMFINMPNITNLDLITFDTRKVTNMASMFSNIPNIENIDLHTFETPSLTTMANMFNNSQKIKKIDLSNFNTSNVTSMDALVGNTLVEELNLSNWDFSKYNKISLMMNLFAGNNQSLKKLNMNNTKFGDIMTSAFYNLVNLEEISIENIDTSNVTNMDGLFNGLGKIKELDLSSWNTNKLVSLESAFVNMASLEKINFTGWKFNNCHGEYFKYIFSGDTNIKEMNFENATFKGSLASAFYQMSSLERLNFKNANTEEVNNMYYMFRECENITELDLSSFNTKNVTSMTWMFGYMKKLEKVDVSNFDLSSITDFGYMFGGTALKKLDLSTWDVSHITNMPWGLLHDTTTIEEINLSNWDMRNFDQVNLMGRMLGGSSYALAGGDYSLSYILKKVDLTNAKLPNVEGLFQYMPSVEVLVLNNVDTSNMINMRYMFAGDRNLKELDLSSFNTSNVTNMTSMFADTSNLLELDLSSFDISKVTESGEMFRNSGLTTGYAKDEASRDFFNNTTYKPDGLTFTIKGN